MLRSLSMESAIGYDAATVETMAVDIMEVGAGVGSPTKREGISEAAPKLKEAPDDNVAALATHSKAEPETSVASAVEDKGLDQESGAQDAEAQDVEANCGQGPSGQAP